MGSIDAHNMGYVKFPLFNLKKLCYNCFGYRILKEIGAPGAE